MNKDKGFTMLSQAEVNFISDIIEELMTLADPSEFLEEEAQQALDLLQNAETLSLDTYLDLNKELETMENTTEVKAMTDAEVLAYAENLLKHIDEDGVISKEGKAILEDKENLPSEADQIRIMNIVKERVQNGQQNPTESTSEAVKESGEDKQEREIGQEDSSEATEGSTGEEKASGDQEAASGESPSEA